MKMNDKQRALLTAFLGAMDDHDTCAQRARDALARAEDIAGDLVASFRGQTIPEIILHTGYVVEINRALLATEHARPHHAVRLVRDVLKGD